MDHVRARTEGKLLEALDHADAGNWGKAHLIVQQFETAHACWLHGIVHVLEGDLDNARYWYRRARRPFSAEAASEIAALRAALDGR